MTVRKPPSRRGYVVGPVAFVLHPALRGLYIKTHICVVLVACPHCAAERAEPCRASSGRSGQSGWNSATHYSRRKAAQEFLKKGPKGPRIYVYGPENP